MWRKQYWWWGTLLNAYVPLTLQNLETPWYTPLGSVSLLTTLFLARFHQSHQRNWPSSALPAVNLLIFVAIATVFGHLPSFSRKRFCNLGLRVRGSVYKWASVLSVSKQMVTLLRIFRLPTFSTIL